MIARTGGRILIDALRIHGLGPAFGVPGESFLGALDALYDAAPALRFIVCRHEATASHAAEAYGKATGRPGLCMVTRGPGASHAAIGVHTAKQDSTPLLLLVGLVSRGSRGRDAWQEIDVRATFGSTAKWADVVDDPRRIPEFIARACTTATSGCAGPVVLGFPEDVLTEEATVDDLPPYRSVRPHPSADDVAAFRALLTASERPLVLAGGSGWSAAACADLQRFAERSGVPVATTYRRADVFDNAHPLYAGNAGLGIDPALAQRIRAADLIVAIGTRLDEVTTGGYTLIAAPRPVQRLVHVHPDPNELGHVYAADLPIAAGPAEFLARLAAGEPFDRRRWVSWAAGAQADYLLRRERPPTPGPLDMVAVMRTIRTTLPPDAIVTTGAGNYTMWAHRFLEHRRYGTQLAPVSGAMGYGIPAAIAAKLAHPERTVVAFSGDGCFQMSGHELATARQYGLNFTVVLINNGIYGSIRMHQERHYPGRVVATDILGPDFVAYARAFGCAGELVTTTAEFEPAWRRALAAGVPAVLELRLDPDVLTTDTTLSEIRARATNVEER